MKKLRDLIPIEKVQKLKRVIAHPEVVYMGTPGTLVLVEKFEEMLKENSITRTKKELDAIVADVKKIRDQNPDVFEDKDIRRFLASRAELLNELMEEYISTAISAKFPMLSEDIFEKKRHLTLELIQDHYHLIGDDTKPPLITSPIKDESIAHIRIPMFAYCPLFNESHEVILYEDYVGRRHLRIRASLPGFIGPNIKRAYWDAMSHYYGVLKQICGEPAMNGLVPLDKIAKPEVGAMWIPIGESLKIKTSERIPEPKYYDPAMVLKALDKTYLVHTWHVDDEKPLEQYLKEFMVEGQTRRSKSLKSLDE